jgi:hypothetical protein
MRLHQKAFPKVSISMLDVRFSTVPSRISSSHPAKGRPCAGPSPISLLSDVRPEHMVSDGGRRTESNADRQANGTELKDT